MVLSDLRFLDGDIKWSFSVGPSSAAFFLNGGGWNLYRQEKDSTNYLKTSYREVSSVSILIC